MDIYELKGKLEAMKMFNKGKKLDLINEILEDVNKIIESEENNENI